MRIVLGALLLAHGAAHLVGFLVPWRLLEAEDTPYVTTILAGRVDVGALGIRVVGILWLAAAIAFGVNAVAVWLDTPRALQFTVGLAVASLVLCALGWPAAKIGVPVNLAILALLGLDRLFGWL